MRGPAQSSTPARALRAGLVVLVLGGYLAALGATASGEGLKLLPHLALEHASAPITPPRLVGNAGGGDRVLTTLRPQTHRHGGHVHSHEDGAEGERAHRPAVFPDRQTVRVEVRAEGLHGHDGVFHRHDAPPPEPSVIQTVSLDQHRLPEAPVVPAPPAHRAAGLGASGGALRSIGRSVETPPPIGRG